MLNILSVRSVIYDQFHGSSAGPTYFFRPENADAYAAYYTAMSLIQDTGEAVTAHMASDFSPDPMRAYLEFWGVMQAIAIQQDAIVETHHVIVGSSPTIQPGSSWLKLRDVRRLCAGHPASRTYGVPAPQRTFMSRSFGNYDHIEHRLWDASTGKITFPAFNLRKMINDYDVEASAILSSVLSTMKSKWP